MHEYLRVYREGIAVASWENNNVSLRHAAILGHRLNDLSQKCGVVYMQLICFQVKFHYSDIMQFKRP